MKPAEFKTEQLRPQKVKALLRKIAHWQFNGHKEVAELLRRGKAHGHYFQ